MLKIIRTNYYILSLYNTSGRPGRRTCVCVDSPPVYIGRLDRTPIEDLLYEIMYRGCTFKHLN